MVDGGEVKTTFISKAIAYIATGSDVDFISFTNLKDKIIIHIDATLLVDPTVIKVKETINGVTNRNSSKKDFPANFDNSLQALIYVLDGGGEDIKITLSSAAAGSVDIGINQRRETRL